MGRGIGFGRKKGESIDLSRIEKIFKRESGKEFNRFKEILMHTPIDRWTWPIMLCGMRNEF